MICGSCHTRGEGHGTIGGDPTEYPSSGVEALTFPYPGISPAEFAASYHEEKPGLYADDTGHSRQHHQQYVDHVRSGHYKNPYQLVTCSDCHDSHARDNGPSLRQPATDNTLCLGCHAPYTFGLQSGWTREQEGLAVSEHMAELADMTVGYDPENMMGVASATATGGVGECAGCHMPKTAASQSRFMHESVNAQGQPSGRRIRGDVSSHLLAVILPVQSEVLYTSGGDNNQLPNSCGSCHNDLAGVSPRYTY
jgi:predicted CXXCH cytochrome family protein